VGVFPRHGVDSIAISNGTKVQNSVGESWSSMYDPCLCVIVSDSDRNRFIGSLKSRFTDRDRVTATTIKCRNSEN